MIYNKNNVVTYQDEQYERLFDHPEGCKWRLIIDEDDYDYIDDPSLVAALDNLYKF